MLFFKYIQNLVENYIDSFFCNIVVNEKDEILFLDIKKFLIEFKDIFLKILCGNFDEGFFNLKNLLKNSELLLKIKHRYAFVYLIIFMFSDIFLIIYAYIVSHLWLSKKIYDDYVHNESRREILIFFNIIFLFLLYIIVLNLY